MPKQEKRDIAKAGILTSSNGLKSFRIQTGSKELGQGLERHTVATFKEVSSIKDLEGLTVKGGKVGSNGKMEFREIHESADGKMLVCTTIDGQKHGFDKQTGAVIY